MVKLIILICFSPLTFASYYDVLPKGVRNFTYHVVQTSTVSGSYNSSGDFKGYNVHANINADTVKGINSAVDTYLNTLSASDYQAFSFGTFEGSAASKVFVQAFGGGIGITDKLTMYGHVEYYDAEVDLNIKRTDKGRINVGSAIQLENIPNIDAQIIQSLFVNYYGYKPLGKWQAKNFGDTEIGFMYQLKKWKNARSLINLGFVAPTGKKDNTDILQDIGFGDGQWDIFVEGGGGFSPLEKLSFDFWSRFTYQLPYNDNIRLPESESFPITSRKGNAQIKLGNKFNTNLQTSYNFNGQWSSQAIYTFEKKYIDTFQSQYPDANHILALDTNKLSHSISLSTTYSTINLFKAKKFFAPGSISFSWQNYFAGKNIPTYNRYDFDFKMFF